jgi:endonuclease/exonuclease/phosphatase family metal-dependent hydrolase
MSLNVLSLNIEGHHHLEVLTNFLRHSDFDIICLQEVFACDLPSLEAAFGAKSIYLPLANVTQPNRYRVDPLGVWGVATLSRVPLSDPQTKLYKGQPNLIPQFEDGQPNSVNRGWIGIKVEKSGDTFQVINTHFTWTPDGQANADQRRDWPVFQAQLAELGEFVMMGDFNAPRGRETWDLIAAQYKDNIPPEVQTTLDPEIFRVKDLQIVIDGIFSTPAYHLENVEILTGLSDHCGVRAEIFAR